ncbi:hypothetical protein J1792_20825 [Streptomyces triculaminicus]|uniref:Lipoprotein n=2 Tax=Streptomyces TaxID=1883 RepID=A0A939FNZ3_9ACTN|nr:MULTISPECIES: hypothetical protein [Streptomyces]MBO0655133.1 hypothetical protein [Streptomyces triculaminicus]QSY51000.1 hypothetical protein J3S04_08890 [Streptomyces griseocarneus]
MKRTARVTRSLSALAVAGLALTAVTGCSTEDVRKAAGKEEGTEGRKSVEEKASDAKKKVEDKAVDTVDKAVGGSFEVTYEVTGSVDSVDFNEGKGSAAKPDFTTEEKPKTPWKKTVTLKGIESPTVSAMVTEGEGGCKITYKGKVLDEKTAKASDTGLALCNAVSPLGQ